MKKVTLRGVAFAAIAGLALTIHAQSNNDQSQFPTILQQPVDQCVPIGATATFSVEATNADAYQWLFNGVAVDGATNSSITIASAGVGDVGFYSASVINSSEVVPTRSALLNVYTTPLSTTLKSMTSSLTSGVSSLTSGLIANLTPGGQGGNSIVVFSMPVLSGGGSGSCPGKYCGYVNYLKTPSQGWGWSPSTGTTIYTATDTNQTTTKIQYLGDYGDSGCGQTTVTVPYPAMSPVYRFAIYFPTNTCVPTNAYPITLNGFNP